MIDAPVDVLWSLTADVQRWPDLTPTMTRVTRLDDGPLRVGSRARIKQPGQAEAVWTVTELTEGRGFSWQTRLLGLTMIGSHRLAPVGDGCRNTLGIEVHGRGAGMFWLVFGALMRRAVRTENRGFRDAALRVCGKAQEGADHRHA